MITELLANKINSLRVLSQQVGYFTFEFSRP